MHVLKTTLLLSTALLIGHQAAAQNAPNPLDQFRNDQATQQVPTRPVNPPANTGDVLPSPTVGGFQQEGLGQDQINQALQNYNLGSVSLEEQQNEVERQSREAAFEAMLNGTLPLSPEEIEILLDRYRDVREASESRIGGVPDAEIKMQTVSLDPGVSPPIIVPELGPYSETPIIDNFEIAAIAGDEDMIKILNGTPPAGTEKLNIDGVDARTSAFEFGGKIYVRTPLALLSPGWNSSVKSADGTTVYTIGKSPILLLSDKGKMVRARIDYN